MKENLTIDDIKFPFDGGTYRPGQKELIEEIITAFRNGERYVGCQLHPGGGKGLIAYIVSQFFDRVLFCTNQIALQKQFAKEFEQCNVKMCCAASNYQCVNIPDEDCGIGMCRRGASDGSVISLKDDCPFHEAKTNALKAHIAVLNEAYLLQEYNCSVVGSNMFSRGDMSGENKPELLILDEAANLEFALRGFLTLHISQTILDKFKIKEDMPTLSFKNEKSDMAHIVKCANQILFELSDQMAQMKKKNESINLKDIKDLTAVDIAFLKHYNEIHAYHKGVERFVNDQDLHPANWVYNLDNLGKLELRPIEMFDTANRYLFSIAPKILFLSATFLDEKQFSLSIGLNKIKLIKAPNERGFTQHNLKYIPLVKLNYQNTIESIPILAEAISLIADEHPKEKGIIHLPSFAVGIGIYEWLKKNRKDVYDRIVFHDSKNRIAQLEYHITTKENSILMSPGFYEGISLNDDLSRFQIFTKVPYLNLGDQIIRIKFDKNKQWYSWRVCQKVIQGSGRSVRSAEDWCTTYFLDANLESLYRSGKKYFDDAGFPSLSSITVT